MDGSPFAPLPGTSHKLHDFNDASPGDQGNQQNLLHAMRGGVMSGNEYRVHNMPRAYVSTSAATTVANGAFRTIPWTTATWDTDSMWSSTNPTRLTARTSGLYEVSLFVPWDPTPAAGTLFQIAVLGNGAGQYPGPAGPASPAGFGTYQMLTWPIMMTAGSYVEAWVVQVNNLTFNVSANAQMTATMMSTL